MIFLRELPRALRLNALIALGGAGLFFVAYELTVSVHRYGLVNTTIGVLALVMVAQLCFDVFAGKSGRLPLRYGFEFPLHDGVFKGNAVWALGGLVLLAFWHSEDEGGSRVTETIGLAFVLYYALPWLTDALRTITSSISKNKLMTLRGEDDQQRDRHLEGPDTHG